MSQSRQTVLVVDDERVNIMALAEILRDEVEVLFATDGGAALRIASARQPDLILLDIQMPDMDGYEVCQRLKERAETAEIPVVFVTAMVDEHDETRGLEVGAIDYITKPFSLPIAKARVRNHLQLKRQRDELALLNRELQTYRARVATELEMARQTQAVLMPSTATIGQISATHGLHVASHFEPSSELGGDFWTLRNLDEHKVAVTIVDFSGHGVNAALNTFRLHSLLNEEQFDAHDPAAYLRALNARLVNLLPHGQFATLFYGIIDSARNSLSYAGAGAPHPLIIGPDPCELELADASGVPLGVLEDSVFDNQHTHFPPGASLFLYSDALPESVITGGDRLGEEGLLRVVSECLVEGPRHRFLDRLLERFHACAVRPLKDDLTAVCLTRP